jgi:hypothetical protein
LLKPPDFSGGFLFWQPPQQLRFAAVAYVFRNTGRQEKFDRNFSRHSHLKHTGGLLIEPRIKVISPQFQRRHYEKLAAVMKDTYETASLFHKDPAICQGINMVYDHLIAVLEYDNPSFSKSKFAEACVPNQLYNR